MQQRRGSTYGASGFQLIERGRHGDCAGWNVERVSLGGKGLLLTTLQSEERASEYRQVYKSEPSGKVGSESARRGAGQQDNGAPWNGGAAMTPSCTTSVWLLCQLDKHRIFRPNRCMGSIYNATISRYSAVSPRIDFSAGQARYGGLGTRSDLFCSLPSGN